MAVLILQTNPDGSVSIAAASQVPPELMKDAEQVPDLDAAAEVVKSVLGQDDGGQGGQPGAEPDADQSGGPSDSDTDNQGASFPPKDSPEQGAMDTGFSRARKGY